MLKEVKVYKDYKATGARILLLEKNEVEELISEKSNSQIELLEQANNIELILKFSNLYFYKVFSYTADRLSNIQIFEDSSMTKMLYDSDYIYTGDNLTSIHVTRISDNFSYIKELEYDVDNNLNVIKIEV